MTKQITEFTTCFLAELVSIITMVRYEFNLPYVATLDFFITSLDGKMLEDGEIEGLQVGKNAMNFSLENAKEKIVIITFILDNKFYASQKTIRN